jgi:ABC-type lipoprotein release transport system permease subunit
MLELFLARKYLISSANRLLRTVSAVAVVGVALGVATLIVVISVNNGFLAVFESRILNVYPHLVVMKRFAAFTDYREVEARLEAAPEVRAASHATYDEMMLSAGRRSRGVLVKGIDPDADLYQRAVAPFLDSGSLGDLREPLTARVSGELVTLSPLFQGGLYRLIVDEDAGGGLTASLRVADTTEPGPASCRVRASTLGARPVALTATTSEGEEVALPEGESRDLDLGTYTLVGGGLRLPFECRLGERTLVVARPDLELAALRQPHTDPKLHEARVLIDSFARRELRVAFAASGERAEERSVPRGVRGQLEVIRGAPPRMFLGSGLAEQLDVRAGDTVRLLTPLRGLGNREAAPFGMAPTAQQFEVAGTLTTDFHEFDQRLVVTGYAWMTRFQNQGDEPRWVEVQLRDPGRLNEGERVVRSLLDPFGLPDLLAGMLDVQERAQRIVELRRGPTATRAAPEDRPPEDFVTLMSLASRSLGLMKYEDLRFGHVERFKVIDWEDMNRNLFSSLTLQKVVLSLFFLIIVVIASFSIVSTQLLLLGSKLPDIAILRSMGATRRSVLRLFGLHGLLLAGLGILGGLTLGGGVVLLIEHVRFELDPAVYLISYLPVAPRAGEIALIVGAAVFFSALTVRLGSLYAASRNPIEALRLKR